jgi:phosphatidylserine decarboxylase
MFTPYGKRNISQSLIYSIFFIALSFFLPPFTSMLTIIVAIGFLVFNLQFFRDPDRTTPTKSNIVISPADGKVVLINELEHHHFIDGPAWQICIFMSPINVHVNRVPISGRVAHVKYIPGQYLMAFDEKSSDQNERNEIGIIHENLPLFFTQISGFVARRIICELKVGDEARIGERFGMIKFGSRVDIFIPKSLNINVEKGQRTVAGETILAEF